MSKTKNKWIAGILIGVILLLCVPVGAGAESTSSSEPLSSDVTVNTAIAYCVDTEQILYEKDGGKILAPGPITKLMTA
ncbi:MAG: hypothetical protein J5843_01455, partial [Clostridia bacterium]|nr:hypothetical protein [Clostridia bacterium]